MTVHAIVAMTKDRVIGKLDALPWHIPEDLKKFKKLTIGQTVVMGKRTYESIGRPLPGRNNIVLSFEPEEIEGVRVCASVDEALFQARLLGREIFVIGGASVYEQTLSLVDVLHISHVKKNYPGTVYFPAYDAAEWKVTKREEYEECVYTR